MDAPPTPKNPLLNTEARGVGELRRRLTLANRSVGPSTAKWCDLTVDGLPAEVKVRSCRFERLDFIGLTNTQERALRKGVPFSVFLVCNVRADEEPANFEVIEIDSARLLQLTPKVEQTFYYHGKSLRRVVPAGTGTNPRCS